MESSAQFLLGIGSILLLGLLASSVARRTPLPRVTLLLILGALIGQHGFNLIPLSLTEHFSLIADMTLLMVGFLLGGKLTKTFFYESAGQALWISICAALITALIVSIGMVWLGLPIEIAIILGCIASATDPAAIMDVINETGSDNKFSRLILSIVALDDMWALILFALGMAATQSINGHGGDAPFIINAIIEIAGSIILGLLIGIPAAFLTGQVKKGRPILTEAIAVVFICGGLSMWLDLSYIITAMVMGSTVANLAKHHEYPFHAIDDIESPFLVIFFILAGATLEIEAMQTIGLVGIAYLALRMVGKVLGAKLGGHISGAGSLSKQWLGPALFPQAGVAIGMALVASHVFTEHSQLLLTLAISSTVFFEIIGPIFTHIAIKKMTIEL